MQIESANKIEETGSSAKVKLQIKETGPEGRDIINPGAKPGLYAAILTFADSGYEGLKS